MTLKGIKQRVEMMCVHGGRDKMGRYALRIVRRNLPVRETHGAIVFLRHNENNVC